MFLSVHSYIMDKRTGDILSQRIFICRGNEEYTWETWKMLRKGVRSIMGKDAFCWDQLQASLAFICKRHKLNLKKLPADENKWRKKIAEKSAL